MLFTFNDFTLFKIVHIKKDLIEVFISHFQIYVIGICIRCLLTMSLPLHNLHLSFSSDTYHLLLDCSSSILYCDVVFAFVSTCL